MNKYAHKTSNRHYKVGSPKNRFAVKAELTGGALVKVMNQTSKRILASKKTASVFMVKTGIYDSKGKLTSNYR
jgi:hypothetical protein